MVELVPSPTGLGATLVVIFSPQAVQNFAFGFSVLAHFGQVEDAATTGDVICVPQTVQNLAPSFNRELHLGQFMGIVILR